MSQADVRGRIGYLVKQAQQAFHRAAEERLRPLGLSMSQYAVLRALADAPGAPAAELARRTFVTRQSLRDVLNGLRKAGLATVAERPTSGRALPVALTAEGQARLAEADRVVFDVDERMVDGIGARDLRKLATLLTVCVENLG
ncbi:MarR family winged helix-turn-helix transcriptional regulator [Amycolatopsis sp.]|uniref:MarR family winged helix-turn-helix transcriptional regulator n=1 Tax=Amycolatopsis sp. TaxID=37632 RepID=UPI002C547FD4|nr:MarR family transcriptional regulator [Amycolatopsis sp.]HVV13425.1 MarR family transcriptional regulator [Amycolatopsis sp.]